MCHFHFKSALDLIQSLLTSLGILGAGAWALYIFIKQRENHPRIEFNLDMAFHKKVGNLWLVELVANIENKGKVRHKLYDLKFDLSSMNAEDQPATSEAFGNQAFFPHDILEGSFKRAGMEYFFIEPGVKSKYSFLTWVPADADAVIFHSWFTYPGTKKSHVAETTKIVPKQ